MSQVTSLKKTVTKGEKSKRKQVLEEIERLEKELKDRHQRELEEVGALTDGSSNGGQNKDNQGENWDLTTPNDLAQNFQELKMDATTDRPTRNEGGKQKVNRQRARMVSQVRTPFETEKILGEKSSGT